MEKSAAVSDSNEKFDEKLGENGYRLQIALKTLVRIHLSHSKRIVKILCRNSYERRFIHKVADSFSLPHKSVLDYTKCHTNFGPWKKEDCTCGGERIIYTASLTPMSWVEINNGSQKVIYGSPTVFKPTETRIHTSTLSTFVKRSKKDMRQLNNRQQKETFTAQTFTSLFVFLPKVLCSMIIQLAWKE